MGRVRAECSVEVGVLRLMSHSELLGHFRRRPTPLCASGLCTPRYMERKLCNGDSRILIWPSAPTDGYIP